MLLDYGHMVVHIQNEEQRSLYGLDRLYADVPVVDLDLAPGSEQV
ncbi:RsfS/YbeB/iojap family protein [Nesterenkonia pannonica]|nr:RsfS/YbeB/iojap family protein [Nesterenkonia pannonica]